MTANRRSEPSAATTEPLDVVALYTKLLRVRARLGLFDSVADTRHFPTEIRLLDEVIEEVDRVLPG
jgi:hypothetical protein